MGKENIEKPADEDSFCMIIKKLFSLKLVFEMNFCEHDFNMTREKFYDEYKSSVDNSKYHYEYKDRVSLREIRLVNKRNRMCKHLLYDNV